MSRNREWEKGCSRRVSHVAVAVLLLPLTTCCQVERISGAGGHTTHILRQGVSREEQDDAFWCHIRRQKTCLCLDQVCERIDETLIQGPAIDETPVDLIELMVGGEAVQMLGQ